MSPLSLTVMNRLWPHGDDHVPHLKEAIVDTSTEIFKKFGVTSDLVVAHYMAQFSEECGAGIEMVENMNYSAAGLMRTWPARFGRDRANKFAHNQQMIAETVYGGRMGNAPPPSHDGWDFRGRGLSQLTGRENYKDVGTHLGLDLIADPDIVNDPNHALEIACHDMFTCKYESLNCLEWAEKDNVIGVTRALNGGVIGLSDRRSWLAKWKQAL